MAEGRPAQDLPTLAHPLASLLDHQDLLEALPMAVCIVDASGRLLGHNRRAARLWPAAVGHVRPDDAPFDPFADCTLPDGTESPQVIVLRNGEPMNHLPVTLQQSDGPAVRLLASCAPVKGRDGAVTAVISSFRRWEDEALLDRDDAGIALQRVGRDGSILAANQALLDLLGYRRNEYVGRHVQAFHVDPHNTDALLATLDAGQPLDRFPAQLRARDGSVRSVQISCGALADDAGGSSRWLIHDVTEQRRLNNELQARDQQSRELLHALPVAVFTTDSDGRITFYNEAAVELAGCRPTLGDRWADTWNLFHPDGSAMPYEQCPMAIALREGRPLRGVEVVAERPDGSRAWFLAHPSPLFDADGQLIGAVNMLVEVTQLKQAEQALQELNDTLEQRIAERTRAAEASAEQLRRSERNFSLLVGSVTDYAIYMLDLSGRVTSWNAGAERIKGYGANEVIGRHFSLFYSPKDRAAGIPQSALAQARTEGRFEAEGWRVRKDGTRFWANVVIDPVYDRDQLVGFAKITRDVTERKVAELARLESEQRSRGVIDTALDGFAQIDATGSVVEWNPRAEAMLGWSRAEALGQPLNRLVAASDGHRLEHLPAVGRPGTTGHTRQVEILRRDGSPITVELGMSTLHLPSGDVLNMFIRDLTEKLLIDAQLRQAQKMEAVGQLTGGIAHDFNNLLQGIIGSLDLVQWRIGKQQTDDLGRFIDGALGSAKRAAAMIHRLLAFSRKQPLDPRPVRVNPLIRSMEELLRRTMGEQVKVEFDLGTDLASTLCDPNQLESALLNLSINARDAMPEGGTLTIRSRHVGSDMPLPGKSLRPGEYVCIEVADTGGGMTEAEVERAFDPFYTTKPAGQGTGLGLSMVHGFAHQSDGCCNIQSTPGGGTRVLLYLPRHEDVPAPADTHAPPAPAAPAGASEVVLVVEDDAVVRSVVVDVLQQAGYVTLQAADGKAGLACCNRMRTSTCWSAISDCPA